MGHEILENNVIPIFSRVEQNLTVDAAYTRDMMYINRKLNHSISPSGRIAGSRLSGNHINNNTDRHVTRRDSNSLAMRSTLPRRKHADHHQNLHTVALNRISMSPNNLLESYV